MRDVWKEAKPSDRSPGTYSGWRGLRTRQRIDWILVGGAIEVPSASTVIYHSEGRYPSDHYPVLATLRRTRRRAAFVDAADELASELRSGDASQQRA